MRNSRIFRKCLGLYLFLARWIWHHLPEAFRQRSPGRLYGQHLHALVRLDAERKQYFATFFLRNRPELELMTRLAAQKGSKLRIAVLACSKSAEVYSIMWVLRSKHPDLEISMSAIDISEEILDFGARGVYSLTDPRILTGPSDPSIAQCGDVVWNSCRDQLSSMFERMTSEEIQAMFEVEGDQAKIRPRLKEGIVWMRGDAGDPKLVGALGPQDIVVANRFLCHMEPAAAEKTLRNISRLIKPGGYLFVSGVDLNVRTKVAREIGWKPVWDSVREIHEGDPSLECGWPLEYWGLEPFCDRGSDSAFRYASVFQIGEVMN